MIRHIAPRRRAARRRRHGCGCSPGVEHNLAKVRVEGSNPFARSNSLRLASLERNKGSLGTLFVCPGLVVLSTSPRTIRTSAGSAGKPIPTQMRSNSLLTLAVAIGSVWDDLLCPRLGRTDPARRHGAAALRA